ncbi:hypothetical protein SIO70_20380 [Chitinophaga sancti]|uniref:hypothetical protein n=1 Tax=Chitinophaga sancti TaxID=1004 RepID=UPI002A75F1D2|nr:hypothetical protein [Chitinophaga sancti]WPQ60713.1 hypothetical protein SIO70_20380 [Chitinophaga sancti]
MRGNWEASGGESFMKEKRDTNSISSLMRGNWEASGGESFMKEKRDTNSISSLIRWIFQATGGSSFMKKDCHSGRVLSRMRCNCRPARMLLPGILLVLIPKCPLCLAAWIAVGTGIGISFTVATWLRWGLIAMCIVSLCYLIFKSTVHLWKNSCSSSGKTCKS